MPVRWPSRLLLVRHGESAGNVARDRAHEASSVRIDIAERDADVPLSALGIEQSQALGRWLAGLPEDERPEVVLSSPYVRAKQTAQLLLDAGGLAPGAPGVVVDERLREREFGILDRLTRAGIEELFPDQAQMRARLGKFYHRPPGGESWCDVILRLRSAVDMLSLHYAGRRVIIVAHEVVVLCLRYLLEDLDEQRILAIDAEGDVANCAVTDYVLGPSESGKAGSLVLQSYNRTYPVEQQGAPVTSAPDATVAPR
jgi:broad specificity phosphatase PhoE